MHPSALFQEALNRAADLWGIEPEFWDIWGRLHVAAPETKRAILRALGVPADSPEQLAQAVEERSRRPWTRLVAPSLVLSENQRPRDLPVQTPAALADSPATIEIRGENGWNERLLVSLGELPEAESADVGGHLYVRKRVPLPAYLRIGYYDLTISIAGQPPATMRLILTPDRAWLPDDLRAGGIAISLYGVRSARNWGCGDFRDLRDILRWTAEDVGASFVSLNPLHAIHNRRPFNTSPYLANSVYYQNLIYLDVEALEDFQTSPRAQRLFACAETQQRLATLRAAECVEYEKIHALKLCFLKLCFRHFLRECRNDSARAAEFGAFVAREGELLNRFATYCALDEHIHARHPDVWIWPDWPAPFQDPDSPETAAFRKKHWRPIVFYKYVQWQIDRQLAETQAYARALGMPIGLYLDLALATDRCGSDMWAHRPFFVAGCRVGSPPDGFSPKGQDWAFPPPNSDHHYETGYRLFRDSIRNNCRHGGALRIDHVMRFFRLYWIPDAADATAGAYVRDRYEDLLRILALESVRHQVVLVGEDLGTVQPAVREILSRFSILSYRVFYFERAADGSFRSNAEYPENALVSTTTHDLPTLAGFWINEDIEARWKAGTLPDEDSYRAQLADRARDKQHILDLLHRLERLPENFPHAAAEVPELSDELHNAVIGFLASTPSRLLLVNQEDLTKEIHQQNLPGTTSQYPNWSRKMKFTVEELHSDPTARAFTQMFHNWLARTHRLL